MTMCPRIKVLQPQPFDIVDQRVSAPDLIVPGQQLRVPLGNQI